MVAERVKIKGTVEKIIYQSTESWYSVCDVFTDNSNQIVVVGTMPYISTGEEIEATGCWVLNKDYGRQFKVEEYKKILPKQKNSILRYLSSGAIKGVGPKIAKKIVDQYGEDSFDVIANHPDWLIQISGISRKKAYEINFDFKEKSEIRDILTLSNGTVSSNEAVKIHKSWGKNSINILKENPYMLCFGDFGIGFKRADEIAFSFGIGIRDKNRIECGLRYVLQVYANRDGHTYVPNKLIKESACKLLNVDQTDLEGFFEEEGKIKGVVSIKVNNEPCLALNELYFSEVNIAKKLEYLDKHVTRLDSSNTLYIIEELENRDGIKYANMQKKAIFKSLESGISIITGGPGTGKTTVVRALINIFNRFGMDYALCAPTGRAAKRMSEATLNEAKTIHRLLEVESGGEFSGKPRFCRNAQNPLEQDVIIVDETSMIDVSLMNALLTAIKPGTRIVFIGDINQLPSVGEGNILHDMITSEKFSVVCLNEIFRQSKQSGIVVNAHKINNGEYPDFNEKYDDFFFIPVNEEEIPNYVANLCKNRLPKKYGDDIEEKIQIIAPTKRSISGTINLNSVIQDHINPKSSNKEEIKHGETHVFREGDKIMQLKNNYDVEWYDSNNGIETLGKGVFNGDIGKITSISDEFIQIDFSGKKIEFTNAEIDQIDHAYAITVHKSQGSEYPIVIIPIPSTCPPILRTRNLIYTAITRAEKMVIVVGDKETFLQMIDNNSKANRNTMLSALLRGKNEN
ncbi:MAG: ATP-dependent RecD-like DNA helicase [Clostridia bacterium]|nr:ATP-dependent RecD-like DNA helicase [Clostridia bacterium]